MLKWADVRKMLDECAGGWSDEVKTHNRLIRYSGKLAKLPLGEHSKRGESEGRAEIEIGYIEKMVHLFGIEECAQRNLKQLAARKKKSKRASNKGE